MNFAPKSEEQIRQDEQERRLWPEGEYGFEILSDATMYQEIQYTEDRKSKKGDDMIQLVIKVYHEDGRHQILRDWLLEAFMSKLRNACYACGIGHKYEYGSVCADDFIGRSGNLTLGIEKGKANPAGGFYPDKNKVVDYVVVKHEPATVIGDDDDTPF